MVRKAPKVKHMKQAKCNVCKKDILLPTSSDDEFTATGLFCGCLNNPICFECNMHIARVHSKNCAFGFPKPGDWFHPQEELK
jgi:hypothetical protein